MKKISTLMLSLAVAGSAFAADQFTKVASATTSLVEIPMDKVVFVDEPHKMVEPTASNNLFKSFKAAENDDVRDHLQLGEYFTLDNMGQYFQATVTEITAGESAGNYILNNFLLADRPLPLEKSIYEENGKQYEVLSIPSKTPAWTKDGVELVIMLCEFDPESGKYKLYTNNIDFSVNEKGTELFSLYGCGIGFVNLGANSLYLGADALLGMVAPNGVMTTEETNEDNEFVPAEYPVWGQYSEDETGQYPPSLIVMGLAGYPNSAYFDVEDQSYVAAYDQLIWVAQNQAGDVFNMYITDAAQDGSYIVEGTITEDPATECSVVNLPGPWGVYSEELGGYYMGYQNSKLTFNYNFFDPAKGGIDNVTVDSDNANKPVEYFNLQGVKVANPANGIYIRKQGTSVSKVLVK